jgi:hypothetical protein
LLYPPDPAQRDKIAPERLQWARIDCSKNDCWFFQNRINQYIFGNLDNKQLFIYFLLWSFIAFSGPNLTAYYSLINKPKNVLKMNVYILLFVLIVSIPLSYNYGAIGWISGLTLSHIPLLLILIVIMRNKFKT